MTHRPQFTFKHSSDSLSFLYRFGLGFHLFTPSLRLLTFIKSKNLSNVQINCCFSCDRIFLISKCFCNRCADDPQLLANKTYNIKLRTEYIHHRNNCNSTKHYLCCQIYSHFRVGRKLDVFPLKFRQNREARCCTLYSTMSLIKINQLLPFDVFPIYLKQQEQVDMQLLLYHIPLTEIQRFFVQL